MAVRTKRPSYIDSTSNDYPTLDEGGTGLPAHVFSVVRSIGLTPQEIDGKKVYKADSTKAGIRINTAVRLQKDGGEVTKAASMFVNCTADVKDTPNGIGVEMFILNKVFDVYGLLDTDRDRIRSLLKTEAKGNFDLLFDKTMLPRRDGGALIDYDDNGEPIMDEPRACEIMMDTISQDTCDEIFAILDAIGDFTVDIKTTITGTDNEGHNTHRYDITRAKRV